MALIIFGLGNPGERYAKTRHNVGFEVVDELARLNEIRLVRRLWNRYEYGKKDVAGEQLSLVKPLTYMNRSGEAVGSALRRARVSVQRALFVCDSLDLEVGRCRLKRRGSSAGHRGLQSVIEHLGSREFMRLYIGIGRPPESEEVVEYVLGRPPDEERALLDRAIASAVESVQRLLVTPVERVMNDLNRRE